MGQEQSQWSEAEYLSLTGNRLVELTAALLVGLELDIAAVLASGQL
jgi:hypothetical protein